MSLPMHQRVFQLRIPGFPGFSSFSSFSSFSDSDLAGHGGLAVGEDPPHVLLRKEHRGNRFHGPREFWRQGEDGEFQIAVHAAFVEIVGGERVIRQRGEQRPLPRNRGTALRGGQSEGFPAPHDGNRGNGQGGRGQRGEGSGAGDEVEVDDGDCAAERRHHQRNSVPRLADARDGHGGERRKRRGGERPGKEALAVEGVDAAVARSADRQHAERPQRQELHGNRGEVAESGRQRHGLDLERRRRAVGAR